MLLLLRFLSQLRMCRRLPESCQPCRILGCRHLQRVASNESELLLSVLVVSEDDPLSVNDEFPLHTEIAFFFPVATIPSCNVVLIKELARYERNRGADGTTEQDETLVHG